MRSSLANVSEEFFFCNPHPIFSCFYSFFSVFFSIFASAKTETQ